MRNWYPGLRNWQGEETGNRLNNLRGKTFVYNPYSILNLCKKQVIRDYWFSTGTPTFLMHQIRDKEYHLKYLSSGKQILLLGIGFDIGQKNIGDYPLEKLP